MCGICGIINNSNESVKGESLYRMMSSIKHRGPDDEGVFIENNIGLGFVRLSIIDLSSSGNQPMFSDDSRYVIVYNGEIYNYIELREELRAKGYNFTTKTDTEVLLKSYIEWGDQCLLRFNGMWAFVIYDKIEKELFAARDRYGVKPFYFYCNDEQFIFASEIPPILSILPHKPKQNNQAIFDYLVFNRTDQTETTFFEGIYKLQHGHFIKINLNLPIQGGIKGKVNHQKWYDLRSNLKPAFKNPTEFYNSLRSAIKIRLRSDVPVGVCFSGGLDSSSIVTILLKDFNKADLNTFSAVYQEGQKGDESKYIKLYNSELKNMFLTYPDAASFFKDMKFFIKAHAEPVPDSSPYAQYKVMELAKSNVVVTLDGQGADELLAGYHYFFGVYFKELLANLRLWRFFTEMVSYLKKHRSLFAIKTFFYFILPSKLRTSFSISSKAYLRRGFIKNFKKANIISDSLYGSKNLHEALINHFDYKLEHLLKWEDRNSMWFSLEARVPFLDHNLVEMVLSLPPQMLINKGTTKYILREAMKNKLPEPIRLRKDKIGFSTPEDEWFRSPEFVKYVKDLVSCDNFKLRGYFDYKKCLALFEKHIDKKINISKEIWKWINLELWFREFID